MRKKLIGFILGMLAGLYLVVNAMAEYQDAPESREFYVQAGSTLNGSLNSTPGEDGTVFYVTTEPIKGSLSLDENGEFSYTPDKNRKGRDYFGYRLRDGLGNVSQEATVIIRITEHQLSRA